MTMSGDGTSRPEIPPDAFRDEPGEMMSQADIVAFLTARGIEPLRDWHPGEPLLYVIEDSYRTDTAHYGDLPKRLRPSVARLDNPDSLDSSDRAVDRDGRWSRIFRIVNQSGGQVDYYAIDPDSHEVTFVRSSPSKRDQDYPYVAPEGLLFRAGDALFPKA
ncbi:MAG: hypothetical protein QOJ91_2443 [Sphingomonadales bacterium]|jgi:hypothetical protein|nr:hypothetical protein [Sphingomonadales bacterium]